MLPSACGAATAQHRHTAHTSCQSIRGAGEVDKSLLLWGFQKITLKYPAHRSDGSKFVRKQTVDAKATGFCVAFRIVAKYLSIFPDPIKLKGSRSNQLCYTRDEPTGLFPNCNIYCAIFLIDN